MGRTETLGLATAFPARPNSSVEAMGPTQVLTLALVQ